MDALFDPLPVEYLPSGDHGLLMAWVVQPLKGPSGILCLEDGRAVMATIDEFKFDYRWSDEHQAFVDVSKIIVGQPDEGEAPDVDANQEAPDDGGSAVPGLVPEPD